MQSPPSANLQDKGENASAPAAVAQPAAELKVLSFNAWSDAPRNASWIRRRDDVAAVLRRHEPDLAGLQELTLPMLRDMEARLPAYRWVGAGRDDGCEAGEYTPIFYHAGRFRLKETGSFWLSAACDRPGRGWDAACSRIVTWARLAEQSSGREVVHLNTHLDHLGRKARLESSRLLRRKIAELAHETPAILTGDLNCRDSSAPYRLLTDQLPFSEPYARSARIYDTRYRAEQPPEGPRETFRGIFGLLRARIDYIFASEGLRALRHVVLDEAARASDHRPVLAVLAFANSSG